MIRTRSILIVIALTITTHLFGQTKIELEEKKPTIEVIGTAENEIIPDEIYISIVIREKYVGKDKITVEAQEEKLKNSLKEIGIDVNLSLSDANTDFIRVKWITKGTGIKKDYTLKVSKASTVGQVFQRLERLEITDAYISRVNHSKIDSLKKQVRILAIKAAKNRADYLLGAIGEQTGKPLIVQEKENGTIPISGLITHRLRSETSSSYYVDGVMVKNDEDIQFQKIKIQVVMYVKFLIQ